MQKIQKISKKKITLFLVFAFIAFNLGMLLSHLVKAKDNHQEAVVANANSQPATQPRQPVTQVVATNVSKTDENVKTIVATILSEPRSLSSFKLTDDHQQLFTNENLRGHWTLMYFGFTSCPHICPANMTVLKNVYSKLKQENKTLPQVVFISLDPDRDTASRIERFVSSFNKNFKGATGSEQQLDQLTKELSVVYMKITQPNASKQEVNDYQIDHSGSIIVLNPQGKFYAVFSTPHEANSIAKDLVAMTDK